MRRCSPDPGNLVCDQPLETPPPLHPRVDPPVEVAVLEGSPHLARPVGKMNNTLINAERCIETSSH